MRLSSAWCTAQIPYAFGSFANSIWVNQRGTEAASSTNFELRQSASAQEPSPEGAWTHFSKRAGRSAQAGWLPVRSLRTCLFQEYAADRPHHSGRTPGSGRARQLGSAMSSAQSEKTGYGRSEIHPFLSRSASATSHRRSFPKRFLLAANQRENTHRATK